MAPVGNLRIKESVSPDGTHNQQTFPIAEVVALQHDFLEYANEQGAAVGGANGAVGVAPKLLLMVENEKVFIDADFAPMKADPEITTRLFKWGGNFEQSGTVRFGYLRQVVLKLVPVLCHAR